MFTTFDHITESATVTSPKTGRILRLDRRAMKYITPAQRAAFVKAQPAAMVSFTTKDLRDFLEASEASRDEYKDGLNDDDLYGPCIASEENDGECPHCEQLFRR